MPRTLPPVGYVEPMLPTLVDVPPAGNEWLHEIKYDGYRTELTIRGKDVHAYTRNGHDWTEKYGPVGACSFAEIGKLNLARFAELPGDWRRRQGWFTPDAQPSLNSAAQVVGSRTDRMRAWQPGRRGSLDE